MPMSRTSLIIGNSDGIGAAVTRALVAKGERVIGVSWSGSPLGSEGPRHEICDVTSPEYPALLERLIREEDPIDACVYCVGIGSALALPDLSSEARVIEVNLTGMVKTMAAVVPRWIERRRGHFIGLSSLADDLYNPEAPSYSASKAGFSNYLQGMARALKLHGIAVTNVRFGFVDTKMAKAEKKPLLLTADEAGQRVVSCLETRAMLKRLTRSVSRPPPCIGMARPWLSPIRRRARFRSRRRSCRICRRLGVNAGRLDSRP